MSGMSTVAISVFSENLGNRTKRKIGTFPVGSFESLTETLHNNMMVLKVVDYDLLTKADSTPIDRSNWDSERNKNKRLKGPLGVIVQYNITSFSNITSFDKVRRTANLQLEWSAGADGFNPSIKFGSVASTSIPQHDFPIFPGLSFRDSVAKIATDFQMMCYLYSSHPTSGRLQRECITRIFNCAVLAAQYIHATKGMHMYPLKPRMGREVTGRRAAGKLDYTAEYRSYPVLILEAKPHGIIDSLPQAMAQMLAVREHMGSQLLHACGGTVGNNKRDLHKMKELQRIITYAFVTTGLEWMLLSFDPSKPAEECFTRSETCIITPLPGVNSVALPASSRTAAAPNAGGDGVNPAVDGIVKPDADGNAIKPAVGRNAVKPAVDGNTAAAPAAGGHAVKPAVGGIAIIPDVGGSAAAPTTAGSITADPASAGPSVVSTAVGGTAVELCVAGPAAGNTAANQAMGADVGDITAGITAFDAAYLAGMQHGDSKVLTRCIDAVVRVVASVLLKHMENVDAAIAADPKVAVAYMDVGDANNTGA